MSISFAQLHSEEYNVRCCNCKAEFIEEDIIYDGEDDIEYCPYCGEGGCIEDI